MRVRTRLVAFVLAIGIPTPTLLLARTPTPARPCGTIGTPAQGAPRFALLVGINDYVHTAANYPNDGLRPLYGAENDALDMKAVLVQQYGFPDDKEHIRVLLSMKREQEATRKNILDGLDTFLAKAAETHAQSTIVFFYSGHGSTVDDSSNDESDHRDETIVPADAREKGVHDITDDEIDQRIGRIIKAHPANLTLIFDSCHSGTVSRGDAALVLKEAPPEVVAKQSPATTQAGPENATSDDGYADRSKDYVVIAGSLSWQQSYEMPVNRLADPKHHNGVLTYNLVQALRLNPGATYREVMQGVAAAVQQTFNYQTPETEGDIDRPFFGTAGERRKTPIAVLDFKDMTVKIDAGKSLGLAVGTQIALYDASATDLKGTSGLLAKATVTEVADFTSYARVAMANAQVMTIPRDAKAVVTSPSFGAAPMAVAFDTSKSGGAGASVEGTGAAFLERVKANIEEQDLVTITGVPNPLGEATKSNWEVAIVRGNYGDFCVRTARAPGKDAAKEASLMDSKAEGYYLVQKDGWALHNFFAAADDPKVAASRIADVLQMHARIENLRALSNDAASLKDLISLDVYSVDAKDAQPKASDQPINKLEVLPRLRSGQFFVVSITNNSDRDLYVYLYALGVSGKIHLVELPVGRDEPLKKRESGANHTVTKTYVTSPPTGVDTFKLIASTKKITAPQILEQFGVTARDGESPLERLLRKAATGARDVEPATQGPGIDEWMTARVDIENVP